MSLYWVIQNLKSNLTYTQNLRKKLFYPLLVIEVLYLYLKQIIYFKKSPRSISYVRNSY